MSGRVGNAKLRRLSSMSQLQLYKKRLQQDMRSARRNIGEDYRDKIGTLAGIFGIGSPHGRRSGRKHSRRHHPGERDYFEEGCTCGCDCGPECDCGCQSGEECTCGCCSERHYGHGRHSGRSGYHGSRSRWDVALDLFYALGGLNGMVRYARYGYGLVSHLIEARRWKKYGCGCTEE